MGSKECMNGLCRANSSVHWKKGWPLRSGELATLCNTCGTAYEQLVFCDVFHSNDTGWRECSSCGKRLHCGCIASSSLLELLESGGVSCIGCVKSSQLHIMLTQEKDKGCTANSVGEEQSTSGGSQMNGCNVEKTISMQFGDGCEILSRKPSLPSQNDTRSKELCQIKLEEVGSTCPSNFNQALFESSQPSKSKLYNTHMGAKESPVQTNLSISLSVPLGNTNIGAETVVEERELGKMISSFAQGSRSRHIVPKPPKSSFASGLEATASMIPHIRVARPPVEGRIKNQLLPRYWPRITDQELQQISGDSNSTIVPLFEKVLSASDAGRIGRLVLPKACAEAYFPPISQPEGLPLRIQDIKGKEWVFQFRFWPNNNSRMYVLEGVTPCIQSMQLQAGDTVIFSRMDPEGKLLMGFRKASNAIPAQDANLGVIPCGAFSNETFFSAVTESVPIMSGYSGMLQSFRGSREASLNAPSKHLSGGELSWYLNEKIGNKNGDAPHSLSLMTSERKRSRNLGSKSKRLLIDRQDALELKLSWEEIQDMLRPPLSARLSTVKIEDHEFEEYEEPPVFAKRSIFTVRLSGEQEQWAQCDICFKWRRLPADYLLPPQWTCRDNIWDLGRCSCSASDELAPQELECLLKMDMDLKKRRNATSHKSVNAKGSSDMDAQGNGGGPRDDAQDPGSSSVATTTKHPRHRPGCSCIVCIQPPSGKGKHKPSCSCNVCMTVKRRFKTLMMRKKKRQSEREAELAQRNQFVWGPAKEEAEVDSVPRQAKFQVRVHLSSDKERSGSDLQPSGQGQSTNQFHKIPESAGKAPLDLNYHPDRDVIAGSSSRVSMVSLLRQASLPLENYLKQNGLTTLASEQQGSSTGSQMAPQDGGEIDVIQANEDQCIATTAAEEQDNDFCDEISERDESANEIKKLPPH